MEHRVDEFAVLGQRLPGGVGHRLVYFTAVSCRLIPPALRVLRGVGLAAAGVGAQLGVGGVDPRRELAQGVGPGGHRLGLEGLGLEGGGHLGAHHAVDVVLQSQGGHLPVGQQQPHRLIRGDGGPPPGAFQNLALRLAAGRGRGPRASGGQKEGPGDDKNHRQTDKPRPDSPLPLHDLPPLSVDFSPWVL